MYEAFYGLTGRPFSTVPDSDGIFWSESHAQAFAVLRWSLMSRAPVTVLTGAIGTGKTTLILRLLAEMPEEPAVALVSTIAEGRGAVLDWIMMALGQPAGGGSHAESFARFREFADQRHAEGRRVLVIVDEAQNLGPAALEELRLLTNVNANGAESVQLVLSGQPQLRETLAAPGLRQFAQRVCADHHLDRLGPGETADYVAARLQAAGAGRRIFPAASCSLVHEATGGVPRLINILCDLALVCGYAAERPVIGEDLLREVLEEARARGTFPQFGPLAPPLTLVPGADAGAVAAAHARHG